MMNKFTKAWLDANKNNFGEQLPNEAELQEQINNKDAEIERLREALKEIWDLTHNKQKIRLIDALIEIDIVIKQAIEEVNND